MIRAGIMNAILELTPDPSWVLEAVGRDGLREGSAESRFAISNGFLGIRGGCATGHGLHWVVPSRTYVAGLFDTPETDNGVPELVPAADWLDLRVRLSGKPMVRHPGEVSSYRTALDMRRGAL